MSAAWCDGELRPRREWQIVIEGIYVVVWILVFFRQLLRNRSSFSVRTCQPFAGEYDVVAVLALLAGYVMMTKLLPNVMGNY